MMISFLRISGGAAALLLASALSGCGEDNSVSKPGEGFLKDTTTNKSTFKSTDVTQFGKMVDQMKSNMKSGSYAHRPAPTAKDKAGAGKGGQEAAPKAEGGDK